MNEFTLSRYMLTDPFTVKYFNGVLSYDELPTQFAKPGLYIVNTDVSYGPGKHWVCLYIDNKIEYFDSLGREPDQLLYFIQNQNMEYSFNTRQIQNSFSDVCGDYCMLYCYFRARGHSLSWFINLFGNDLQDNDETVSL